MRGTGLRNSAEAVSCSGVSKEEPGVEIRGALDSVHADLAGAGREWL